MYLQKQIQEQNSTRQLKLLLCITQMSLHTNIGIFVGDGVHANLISRQDCLLMIMIRGARGPDPADSDLAATGVRTQ